MTYLSDRSLLIACHWYPLSIHTQTRDQCQQRNPNTDLNIKTNKQRGTKSFRTSVYDIVVNMCLLFTLLQSANEKYQQQKPKIVINFKLPKWENSIRKTVKKQTFVGNTFCLILTYSTGNRPTDNPPACVHLCIVTGIMPTTQTVIKTK